MSNVIKVPKPPLTAYNPNRSLEKNVLVKNQVDHFREVEAQLPEHLRSGMDPSKIKTEGQASEYLKKVTHAIHKAGGRKLKHAHEQR